MREDKKHLFFVELDNKTYYLYHRTFESALINLYNAIKNGEVKEKAIIRRGEQNIIIECLINGGEYEKILQS